MAGIELTLAGLWWVLKGENILVGLMQKTLLLGLFAFFVANWATLINTVLDGFVWAGFTAGGSSPAAGAAIIKDPSAIISQAFIVTQPLENEVNALSLYNIGSLVLLWLGVHIHDPRLFHAGDPGLHHLPGILSRRRVKPHPCALSACSNTPLSSPSAHLAAS